MATENKLEQQKNIADHFKVTIDNDNIKDYEAALKLEDQTTSFTAEVEDTLKTLQQRNNGETTTPLNEDKEKVKSDRETRLARPVQEWNIGNGAVHVFKNGTELPNQIFVELMADSFANFLTAEEAWLLMRRFADKWAEEKNSLKPLSPEEKAKREAARKESLKSQVE